MDEKEKKVIGDDEFLKAFNQLRDEIKNGKSEGSVIQKDDIKVSEEEVFKKEAKEEPALKREFTIFARKPKMEETQQVKHPVNAGVIDKDEWDRMLKELENQPVKAAEEGEKPEEKTEAAVTRASRSAANQMRTKPKKKKKVSAEKTAHKKKVWKIVLLSILAFGVVCMIAGVVIVGKIIKETPEINPNNIYDMLSQSSVIYDVNGSVVDNIYSGDALRTNVEYSEIPKQLVDAFVSIEDKTFWDHHGFNFVRIGGAVWQWVSGRSSRIGGTSTITQQLARNIYLVDTKSARKIEGLIRKIREAYYTIQIEKTLSKEQIIEAYLNTVYLGFNSNGVYAASRAYFNKDLKDLTLIECAQLAALPQSPNNYAPLKRQLIENVSSPDAIDIVKMDNTYITYYNDTSENRVKLVLRFMHEQGKIDDATYETAKADSIRNYLNPGINIGNSANDSSYFSDYITSQVMKDLQKKLNYSYEEAHDLLYNGGLIVNSTLDMDVQVLVEGVFADESVFPKINTKTCKWDKDLNLMNPDKTKVVLYNFDRTISTDGAFALKDGEYTWNSDGSLTINKGKRLSFYNTKSNGATDVRVDIKDMYELIDGTLYSRSSNCINIPSKYKTRDDAGNLVLSADFFENEKDAFIKGADGSFRFTNKYIVLGSRIIQPQSAMVIIESSTGQIRAMMGGRGIKGKLLYNRAINTRQPGSSIKPLAIYSTALQKGYENAIAKAAGAEEYGPIFTAATPLDNAPGNFSDELWPSNFDGTYTGILPLRRAVELSLNACAVNLYNQLDPQDCVQNLLNYGITSFVNAETGDTDVNTSALALGGMLKGISPLEMCSAYSTFANGGVHNDYTCYTTVTNRKGDIILSAENHPVIVLDEPVASLMLNILKSTVENGIASGAKLKSQPTAGKTGTTSDAYDIWFCGLTPKYSAAIWLGCDSNVNLGTDSSKATKVWKAVMEKVGALDERQEFNFQGDFVTMTVDMKTGLLPSMSEYADIPEEDLRSEIFIKGTEPKTANDDARGYVAVCSQTGYLATPYCSTAYKSFVKRPGGLSWESMLASYTLKVKGSGADVNKANLLHLVLDWNCDEPQYYCPLHNPDPEMYPVSPIVREEYDVEGLVGGGDPLVPEEPNDGEITDIPTIPDVPVIPDVPGGSEQEQRPAA